MYFLSQDHGRFWFFSHSSLGGNDGRTHDKGLADESELSDMFTGLVHPLIESNAESNRFGSSVLSSFPLPRQVASAGESLTCIVSDDFWSLAWRALWRGSTVIVGKAHSCVLFYRNPTVWAPNPSSFSRCVCSEKRRDIQASGALLPPEIPSQVPILGLAKISLRKPPPLKA